MYEATNVLVETLYQGIIADREARSVVDCRFSETWCRRENESYSVTFMLRYLVVKSIVAAFELT